MNFGLIGVAGYVAPKHLKAIKETGHELKVALDPNDSVGIIDRYFNNVDFFTEFERFDRYISKVNKGISPIEFLSVCTPNYLHDSHIRYGLKSNMNVICEKPLVLSPWNLEALAELERNSDKKVFSILQLRLHPSIKLLKKKVEEAPDKNKVYEVDLTYITSRGNWYYASWKGDQEKSGGLAANIGVHFFDVLGWIFGYLLTCTVHINTHDRVAGYLEYKKARVRWFLSINHNTLPERVKKDNIRTYRSITIDGVEIEFSKGFEELHTESYQSIIEGKGFNMHEAQGAINTIYKIKSAKPIGLKGEYHPLAKGPLATHPFNPKN